MMEPVVCEGFAVDIEPAEVRRLLGSKGRKNPAPGERYAEMLEGALAGARGLIAPKGVYARAAGRELPGATIFARLERMAFCVCTIGPALEEEVARRAKHGDLLGAVVLDAIGSVAAEAVAEHMERTIAAEAAREGLKISRRASPGYGNWDVRGQASIFKLLPAERIGVRLSETCMMIPRKSVSFAVHVAREPKRLRCENSCENCDRKDCQDREE